jgi:predicted nuclease of predicted toxin-antitoxin system
MQRWVDDDIADFAVAENRAIVSADTDYGAILPSRQTAKPSFVLLRRTQDLSPESLASLLVANLPAFEVDLDERAVLVITDTVIRVRKLPVMHA